MSITFAAATMALASFGSFSEAVEAFETCQANAAYGIIAPNTTEFSTCQDIYTGIKLEFVDPTLVAEYESLRRNPSKTDDDYRRMHEISLLGYAGWTDWKKANADTYRPLVSDKLDEARAAVGL